MLVNQAKRLLSCCSGKLMLPVDVIVADAFSNDANSNEATVGQIKPGWRALDIGPHTVAQYENALKDAKMIIWNGPMGVFEMPKVRNRHHSYCATPSRPATQSVSSVVATRSLRSSTRAWPTRSRISAPAAAHRWSFSKARNCRGLRCCRTNEIAETRFRTNRVSGLPETFMSTIANTDAIREFVIAGHGNLDRVKEMLAEHPELLSVAHEWQPGDTETALQGASHVGNCAIAEYLLTQGAPLDICAAAMLASASPLSTFYQTTLPLSKRTVRTASRC